MKIARRQVLKSLAASLFAPAFAGAQAPFPPVKLAMIEGLSGGNANGGEAVFRNLVWAVERVNQRGGVRTAQGMRALQLERYDNKGQVEGDELQPLMRIKDFAPYATKIKASGAQAVITGNFSNDLTLLVKAAKEVGFDGKFYTFYGNALGAPAAIGDAGLGKVIAVADWLPNVPTAQ